MDYIGDVAEDVSGWVTDVAADAEDIYDGTYCFEDECPPDEK